MMRPLEGIRIADFTLHAAGPFSTHILSMLGAQCIKIESALRPDIFRRAHPVYGRLEAASFDQVSSNKLSVTLNLKDEQGVALAKRLVSVSNVVVESFRPGVMSRLGLGFDELRKVRPDLVMLSVSSSGQTGPDRQFAGYAPLFGAWGGLGYLTGYSDGPPVEMRHVMDHSVGLAAAFAMLSAIYYQRTTGRGQHVDVAAREVASSFLGEALLEAAAGRTPERSGNTHPAMAPYGTYPCREPETWISLAVEDDPEWQQLARALGRTDWTADARFATTSDRLAHRQALDEAMAEMTSALEAGELAERLQALGIAAVPAWSTRDLAADPHLRARGALVTLSGLNGLERDVVGSPFRMSRCTTGIDRWTPALGEHNDFVFGELLGIGDEDRKRLTEEGVIL